ncbi:hypothetical protein BDY19DRAFT_970801 [Irpex rosettiformis]|uniref:Uncharacterized protein n=1 Tax=Irpex rosettiformis TaxID=378272 RepID=A0ACB8TR71_9APHY|nr:hypothetical protein BDY19DRAFT_970801 [Irpex rosettiformis]
MSSNDSTSTLIIPEGDDTQTTLQSELLQDPDIWMVDGNVILAVKDRDNVTWGLKCHKSVLARHSTVWDQLFFLNQPPHADNDDSTPVVTPTDSHGVMRTLVQILYNPMKYFQLLFTQNQPPHVSHAEEYDVDITPIIAFTDSHEDMKGLLQVLYDPIRYLPKLQTTAPLTIQKELEGIDGPLRLSLKYKLDKLHAHLTEALELRWPSELERWDVVSKQIREVSQETSGAMMNAAVIILLAEEAEVPSLLPAAYYEVNTWRRNSQRPVRKGHFDADRPRSVHHLRNLQEHHHLRLAEGREYFQTVLTELLGDFIPSQIIGACACRTKNCSINLKNKLNKHLMKNTISGDFLLDPLSVLLDIRESISRAPAFESSQCSPGCLRKLLTALDGCRQYIWDEIPFAFGIKKREDVKDYGYGRYLEGQPLDADDDM